MSSHCRRHYTEPAPAEVGAFKQEAVKMISNWKRIAVLGGVGGVIAAAGVLATPASGVSGIVLVRAAFAEMDAKTQTEALDVKLKSTGVLDVVVNQNSMTVGGSSGWHTHPGPTFVSVKTGALTLYDGDDPNCTATVYPAGTGFVDPGGGHVHLARNEGAVAAEWFTTYIVPRGEGTRLDAPRPGNCAF